MKTLKTWIPVAVGALFLGACGSGGGDDAGVPLVAGTDVPQSATTSSAGAIAFIKTVTANQDNTSTPLVVGDVTLATSDTDEPDPGV